MRAGAAEYLSGSSCPGCDLTISPACWCSPILVPTLRGSSGGSGPPPRAHLRPGGGARHNHRPPRRAGGQWSGARRRCCEPGPGSGSGRSRSAELLVPGFGGEFPRGGELTAEFRGKLSQKRKPSRKPGISGHDSLIVERYPLPDRKVSTKPRPIGPVTRASKKSNTPARVISHVLGYRPGGLQPQAGLDIDHGHPRWARWQPNGRERRRPASIFEPRGPGCDD